MQVKLGPLVSDAAGSFGGLTIQRDPLGHIVRTKPSPTRRRTTWTTDARSPFAGLGKLWRSYTQARRDEWQAMADSLEWHNRFGDPVRGLGWWLYVQCNRYNLLAGWGVFDDPQEYVGTSTITGLSIASSWGAGVLRLNWTSGAVPSGEYWAIYASPVLSPGTTNPRSRQRLITLAESSQTSPMSIYAPQNERLRNPYGVGGRIFVDVVPFQQEAGYPGPRYRVAATIS